MHWKKCALVCFKHILLHSFKGTVAQVIKRSIALHRSIFSSSATGRRRGNFTLRRFSQKKISACKKQGVCTGTAIKCYTRGNLINIRREIYIRVASLGVEIYYFYTPLLIIPLVRRCTHRRPPRFVVYARSGPENQCSKERNANGASKLELISREKWTAAWSNDACWICY